LKLSYFTRAIARAKAPIAQPLDPARTIEARAELVFAPALPVAVTAGADPVLVLAAAAAAPLVVPAGLPPVVVAVAAAFAAAQ